MGGLFSSNPEPKHTWDGGRTPHNQFLDREEEKWVRQYQVQQNTSFSTKQVSRVSVNQNDIPSCGHRIRTPVVSPSLPSISSRTKTSRTTVDAVSNENYQRTQQILYSAILRKSATLNWNINNVTSNESYRLVRLESWDPEYLNIESRFSKHRSEDIRIISINRVENIYLLGQYYIKKLEYLNKSLPVNERIMFHGTKRHNLDNICTNNFDWRLHGVTKGNIFGKGVSFTPKSSYANHYCDKKDKVMIVVKVLVSNSCEGDRYMEIPDYYNRRRLLRYDASTKPGSYDVLVKYSDDEFYPAYIIHYTGKIFYANKGFYR